MARSGGNRPRAPVVTRRSGGSWNAPGHADVGGWLERRLGQADGGAARRATGRDDAGGLFVTQPVIGDEPDPEGPPVHDLDVTAEAVGKRFEIGQGGFAEPQRLQVAEVIALGAEPE